MTDIYAFSRDAIRQVAREVFREARESRVRRGQIPGIIQPYENRQVQFRNTSGEVIPAYGVMRVTGAEVKAGLRILTVAKPSATFQRLYLVNGPTRVGSGGDARGVGTWLEEDGYVLYESGTPAYGESWGPKAGQWSLAKWRYGFTVVGGLAGTGAGIRVVAKQEPVNTILGKADSAISADSSGTVSIYDGNRSDTTDNLTAYTFTGITDTSAFLFVGWIGGTWYASPAECQA